MKRLGLVLIPILVLGFALSATAADVAIHGDLNHRFMLYTNHNDWMQGEHGGQLADDDVEENWGEIKYRLWVEGASNDGNVKGVYAIEIGGVDFGKPGSEGKGAGGSYSGDAANIETRWAYTDFQVPGVDQTARFKIGLMPFKVNRYLWSETAMGVDFYGNAGGMMDYELAYMRTYQFDLATEPDEDADDVDNVMARLNFKPSNGMKLGLFGLYQFGDPDIDDGDTANYGTITPRSYLLKKFANKVELDIYSVGIDGGMSVPAGNGKFFVNWDGIYQGGSIDSANFGNQYGDFDLSAWFAHADLGMDFGKFKVTYTGWYTSGDDDPTDCDFEGFLATDLDITDSIVLFEGNYSDDNYFTERHYLLDKGFIMNKLAVDFKPTSKLKLGVAGLYMMTAEDIEYSYTDGNDNLVNVSEDGIGIEVDAYMSYMLYSNLEFAVNAGYLAADDAMDYFEVERNGSSDEDIMVTAARVRYKF